MKKLRIIMGILCLSSILAGGIYVYRTEGALDTQAPVLQAESDTITVRIDAEEKELTEGVTALDNRDGDISDNIFIENVQKKEDGKANEFLITYVAFDQANNFGRLTRVLYYEDYRPTHFALSQPLRFPENQELALFDYLQAEDCIDGDLSPFITIEGDKDIQEEPRKGIYDCTLSVVNSVGHTTELPIQIEIYEDSYEERTQKPKIALTEYITYVKQKEKFDAGAYLDHVQDGGIDQVVEDLGSPSEEEGETESDASEAADEKQISLSDIRMDSDVDTNVPGVYSVVYSYTSKESGYSCNTRLIVVVE